MRDHMNCHGCMEQAFTDTSDQADRLAAELTTAERERAELLAALEEAALLFHMEAHKATMNDWGDCASPLCKKYLSLLARLRPEEQ